MSKRFNTLAEWLAWFETLHPKQIDLGLDRIRSILDRLQLRPPPYRVVTVGGTNGKGSCVAMLESIYLAAGYRVGTFTSPHLVRFNERIRFNGRDIESAELIEVFEAIEAALGEVTLSYFEASAVAAFLHFQRQRADVAVLEVGMGGRLDAVNALDADGALIASVDLDHMEFLGPDREAIGYEKAGIFRAGRPGVVGDTHPPASIAAHAANIGTKLVTIGSDFRYRRDAGGGWAYEAGELTRTGMPALAFGGDLQLGNAASCIALIDGLASELPVSEEALRTGLANARLRGRTERQVIDGVEWIFDVAHNPAAAAALRRTLDADYGQRGAESEFAVGMAVGQSSGAPLPGRTLAVFAAMHDKDIAGVVAVMAPVVDRWHLSPTDSERCAPVEQLRTALNGLGVQAIAEHGSIAESCRAAAAEARPGDRVVVFGSFYTVGPALEALGLYSTPPAVGD